MKKILSTLVLIFAFCAITFAQDNQNTACPVIEVQVPSRGGYLSDGEEISFTANVRNYDLNNFKYNWQLSNDISFKGQGTPVIIFTATKEMNMLNVTATVEISGLPENCKKSVSGSFQIVYNPGSLAIIMEYGRIPFREEKGYLDGVIFALKENPNAIVLFIIQFTKKDSISAIKTRVQKITTFLTKTRQISIDKFRFLYSEKDYYITDIYFLPPEEVDSFYDVTKNIEEIEAQRKNRKK